MSNRLSTTISFPSSISNLFYKEKLDHATINRLSDTCFSHLEVKHTLVLALFGSVPMPTPT